jgi:hypothetical protein
VSIHLSDSSSTTSLERNVCLTPTFKLLRIDDLLEVSSGNDSTAHDNSQWNRQHILPADISFPSFVSDLESAIILHNMGIATYCEYLCHPLINFHYQSAAISMLQSSQTLFIRTLQNVTPRKALTNPIESVSLCRSDLVCGWTIVLNTLINTLLLSSSQEKACYYQSILNQAEASAKELKETKERYGFFPTCASVA